MTEAKQRMFDIAQVKAAVSLVDVIKSAGVDLKRRGQEWVGRCPFHSDKNPSFTVFKKAGDWRYKCFPCGETGDVISFMEKFHNLSTFDALMQLSGKDPAALKASPGVRGKGAEDLERRKLIEEAEEARKAKRKRETARALWDASTAYSDAIATYLQARGIALPCREGTWQPDIPASLRFHPAVEYFDLDTRTSLGKLPCMLAPIYNAKRDFIALHRTWLKADFTAKADVPKAKKVLGLFTGGYIPLYPVADGVLNIAEGIETALSARQLQPAVAGIGGFWTCIALDNLKNLVIPPQVALVNIWADNDMSVPEPGKPDLRQRLRDVAEAMRAQMPGRQMKIYWPPMGKDFNDVLRGGQ